jgi:hypothetical protein
MLYIIGDVRSLFFVHMCLSVFGPSPLFVVSVCCAGDRYI